MDGFSSLYSENANAMRKSVIRELLKLTNKPGLISFAGGLPAPETFPVESLRAAADRVLADHAIQALQYGTTEGDEGLKARIIEYEAKRGVRLEPAEILVTSASQQALDMLPKLFLDPGDFVIAGRPSYIGALQAIQSYRGRVLGIPFSPERDGFDMDELELRFARASRDGARIKYIYAIPDFQNPTGICWSLERRLELLAFARRHGLPIVEDAPYRDIRFLGEPLPSLLQLDRDSGGGSVIALRTFSKILAPGLRLGWIAGDPDIVSKLVVAKQAMDLCTGVFTQKWLAEFLAGGEIDRVIARTCALYREKRNHMVAMLSRYMPRRDDLVWTEPEGGLFLWITLPRHVDTDAMFAKAIERNVAYVIGSAFYQDDPERNSMRVNFSYPTLDQIDEGAARLAVVVSDAIAGR